MYEIRRITSTEPYAFSGIFDPEKMDKAWKDLDIVEINEYPWFDMFPEKFPCRVTCGWNETGLNLLMYASESPIMAEET